MKWNHPFFRKVWILTFLFVLIHRIAFTATYYIDYSSGSDSANGTSTSTPWQHCPGDAAATGAAASATLNPGDTVYFKGGVSYVLPASSNIALNWNGASGNPITYDGNSSGSWGTGRAILTDNHANPGSLAFYASGAASNLVFNDFEIGPFGGAASLPPDPGGTNYAPNGISPNNGTGFVFNDKANRITIENCYFHELGYWQNVKPIGANAIEGSAVYHSTGAQSELITNCEFTKIDHVLEFAIGETTTNITIAGCLFHDYIVWCIDFAVVSSNAVMDNINVSGNTFSNFDIMYSWPWTGYGGAPHQDGILERGESVTEGAGGGAVGTFACGTNINFHGNWFRDNGNQGGSCAINVSGGCSANIYNNLFSGCNEPNGTVSYQSPPPNQNFLFQVFNNTFYQNNSAAVYLDGSVNTYNGQGQWSSDFFWPITNTVQVVVKNNIFVDAGPDHWIGLILWDTTNAPLSQFVFDYNDYSTINFIMLATGSDIPADVRYWAGVQSVGWEAHGITSNPLFVNTNTPDLHLQAGSPVIGAGVNLTSLGVQTLNVDYAGNWRPASGAWDTGAFEYVSPAFVPTPMFFRNATQ